VNQTTVQEFEERLEIIARRLIAKLERGSLKTASDDVLEFRCDAETLNMLVKTLSVLDDMTVLR
jgi:hypothetical protein